MKKLLLIIILGLSWFNVVIADEINLRCKTSDGKIFPDQVLNLKNKTMKNLKTNGVDNLIAINNEVKMYFVGYLPGVPVLFADTIDLTTYEWIRISPKEVKKRPYKRLKKKLKKINKKIDGYQIKEMVGEELFQVSKLGTIEQESMKMNLVSETINDNNAEKTQYKCEKF